MTLIRSLRLEQDIINERKSKEQSKDVLALGGNRPSMRLILAWDKVTIRNINCERDEKTLMNLTEWRQVWEYKDIDMEEISEIALISISKVQAHVLQAQANFWVYPDNTVHKYAFDLAQAMAMRILKNMEMVGKK